MKIFSNKFSLWKKKAKVVTVLFLYSSSIFTKPVRSKRRRHCTMYQRKKFRSKNILLKRGWGNRGGCWCPWFRRSDCHFWIEQVFNFQIPCLFIQKLSYGDTLWKLQFEHWGLSKNNVSNLEGGRGQNLDISGNW